MQKFVLSKGLSASSVDKLLTKAELDELAELTVCAYAIGFSELKLDELGNNSDLPVRW